MKSNIFFFVITFISTIANAQFNQSIGDKVKNKSQSKLENRVDNKIDNGIDNALNKFEGLFKKKNKKKSNNQSKEDQETENSSNYESQNTGDSQNLSNTNMFGSNINLEYKFDGNYDLELEHTDKSGKINTLTMQLFFTKTGKYYANKVNMAEKNQANLSTIAVYDIEQMKIYTLMETSGMKTGTQSNFDTKTDNYENTQHTQFQKTNETKIILGKKCTKYIAEDDAYDYEYWLTTDTEVSQQEMFSSIWSQNKQMNKTPEIPNKAFVMELVGKNKANSEKTVMKVVKLNLTKQSSISTSGYKFFSTN